MKASRPFRPHVFDTVSALKLAKSMRNPSKNGERWLRMARNVAWRTMLNSARSRLALLNVEIELEPEKRPAKAWPAIAKA